MGFVAGTYPILASRARNYDCWSRHIEWGLLFLDYHVYFDGAFDPTQWTAWLKLLLKIVSDILQTIDLLTHCKAALDFATWSNWLVFFRLGTASSENPTVGAEEFTTYMMDADTKLNDLQETKESNWLYDLAADLDPINMTLFDED